MTQHLFHDEARTIELVRQLDSDVTWLRHRGLAAELDRRLLQGATEAELAEVRPKSWKGHVLHLREVHRLRVQEQPTGYWRIVGAEPPVGAPGSHLAGDALDDDEQDLQAEDDAPALDVHGDGRLKVTARALAALAGEGLLSNPLLKASVGMLIRQASESQHWHNCAHYRSLKAKSLIDDQRIPTAAKYQAFCRSNLRHEHVVPNSVIYKMLCEAPDKSAEAVESLLTMFCIRATITLEEDRHLSRLGLSSAMPDGFSKVGDPLYRDPLARYKFAQLFEELEERSTELWHCA